ncbi:O-antigen ligase family protein [Sphingobium olei]|uniref:O-antigen ligase family protein n=1 Tax=Sphingobium olei TaxID=420955 RepID=A0ABW3P7Y3_9SPHN|nr:O-antigen ligase family protein [Sphingobium sp.]
MAYYPGRRRLDFSRYYRALAIIAVAILLFATATRLTPLQGDMDVSQSAGEGGSALRQVILFLCAGLVLAASRPLINPAGLLRFPLSMIILLGWCVLSLGWAAAPGVSLRRLILTFLVIWSIFRAVDALGYRQFLKILCYCCIAMLIANYLAVLLKPVAAIHLSADSNDPSLLGAWRGIVPHKNITGPVCALTLFLLVFGIGEMPLVVRLGLIAADIFFLIQTNSKTSMALSLTAILGGYIVKNYHPRVRLLVVPGAIVAGCVLAYVIDTYLPSYLSYLGSSQDAFTGRIQIWRILVDYIQDHLMLGAGFASFWAVGDSGPLSHYTSQRWILLQVAEGHNGYLDITAQLGLIGLGLSVLAIFVVPLAKLIFEADLPDRYRALMFAILFFSIGHNVTESSIMATDQFMQFVLMLVIACIEDMRAPWRAIRHANMMRWVRAAGEEFRLAVAAAIGRVNADKDDPR